MSSAVVASAQKQRKAELIAAYSDSSKGHSIGVILVVASQFASVDTIPNAVRPPAFDKNSSHSAPAELWCEWFSDFSYKGSLCSSV